MIYEEKASNLFNASNTLPLAHCVSKDLKMSAGIALKFKHIFGQDRELHMQNPRVGGLVKIFNLDISP